jgi:4'-phosphopantetheinyl transferase
MRIIESQFVKKKTYRRCPTDGVLIFHLDINALASSKTLTDSMLSESEQARARAFYFLRDRQTYTITRAALKHLLGYYHGVLPNRIAFTYAEHGKPSLPDSEIEFSVSHSGGRAVIAIAFGARVGVDIETFNREAQYLELSKRFFASAEHQKLLTLSGEALKTGFFKCWTQKEAFVKAIGEGLSFPLSQFEVSVLPDEPVGIKILKGSTMPSKRWAMHEITSVPGYISALAVELF